MKARLPLFSGIGFAAAISLALITLSHTSSTIRTPASEPKIYWTHAQKQVHVTSSGLRENFDVEVQQVSEWTETIPYQDTCYRDGSTEEAGTCEGYHCKQAGNGKSEAWDSFYSAPKSGKVNALADAIKGIGPASAEKLVSASYFNKKPRSWDDFTNEIQRAENNGVIGKDIAYQVLVKYKAENATNLGYDLASCSPYQYDCTVYVPGVVAYSCTKYKDEPHTRVIDSMIRHLSIDIQGPSLQSFESDTATLVVGRDRGDVSVDIGPYNRYNVSTTNDGGVTHIHANASQRILVDLPRDVVRSGILQRQNGQAVFALQINSQYLGDGKDQLVLKYNVHTCKMNFFSVCLGSYRSDNDVVVPITQSETMIDIPLQSKSKSKVSYTLARKGSRWYNDNYLSTFETDAISQK